MGNVVKLKAVQQEVRSTFNHHAVVNHLNFVLAEQRRQYSEMKSICDKLSDRLDYLERMEEEITTLRDEVISNLRKLPRGIQLELGRD